MKSGNFLSEELGSLKTEVKKSWKQSAISLAPVNTFLSLLIRRLIKDFVLLLLLT